MEATPLLTELNRFDQTLSPSDTLNTTSVARFRGLLDHADRRIRQLASKILLEHNHDVSLQTQDHKIVPLSFAVLSKFSDIFPEDSDFLSRSSKPIPVPLPSSALNLVTKAWSGELTDGLPDNSKGLSQLEELISAAAYLATEDSIPLSKMIYRLMRQRAPSIDYSIPQKSHMLITCRCQTIQEADELRQALSLAKTVDYTVSLHLKIDSAGANVPYFFPVFGDDIRYPIHRLLINHSLESLPQSAVFAELFFGALTSNQTLKTLALTCIAFKHYGYQCLSQALEKNSTLKRLSIHCFAPYYSPSQSIFFQALKGNKGLKKVTFIQKDRFWIPEKELESTFRSNTTLESLTLKFMSDWECPVPMLKGLAAGCSLKHISLYPGVGKYGGHEALRDMIRKNPQIESLSIYLESEWSETVSSLFKAVREAPRLSFLNLMELDGASDPLFMEQVRLLLSRCPSLTKLVLRRPYSEAAASSLIQGLRENHTLIALNLQRRLSSIGSSYLDPLLEVVDHHPTLTTLTLCEVLDLDNRDWLSLSIFLKRNKTILNLDLTHNQFPQESLPRFLEALKQNSTLQSLNFSSCDISSDHHMLLADYLRTNPPLKKLTIERHWLNAAEADALADALRYNTSLESLSLAHQNGFRTAPGPISGFIQLLLENQTLRSLNLKDFRSITDDQITELKRIARQKEYFNLKTS